MEREAGLYKFVLRYPSGNVRSRLVTPEVFARCRVGDDFRDEGPACAPSDAKDSQVTVALIDRSRSQPVAQHQPRTAQVTKRTHKRHIAKHHRSHRSRNSQRIAAR